MNWRRIMYNSGIGTPYWYEWEIGLIECLKMMSNTDIKSVTLQSSDFKALDDVVVRYNDDSLINIQVKHTDIQGNLSYSFLTTDSLLLNLANEWVKSSFTYNIKEIKLVTNREWGPNSSDGKCSFKKFVNEIYPKLQQDYNYSSKSKDENNAILWFKEILNPLGEKAFEFVKIFNFNSEEAISGTSKKIENMIGKIIGIDDQNAIDLCKNSLFSKLEIWATSKRKIQEINREEMYKALCNVNEIIPPYNLNPEKPIFPSRKRFAESFIDKIKTTNKKIIFIEGLPGVGKTNFLSYLAALESSIVDFRYYTYIPVKSDYPIYSDDEGYYSGKDLWHSLLHQLKEKFEKLNLLSELKFPLIYSFLSVSEMRLQALRFLSIYANLSEHSINIFIDGLDHAARSNSSHSSFISQLPQPHEISDNVKFILIGQPINDKYPNWLVENDEIEYLKIPSLEKEDVLLILSTEEISIDGVSKNTVADAVISVVGNNTLNVLFSLWELKKLETKLDYDGLVQFLKDRQLNCQINRYYEWILGRIEKNIEFLKIEAIFAYSSSKISVVQLASMCGCDKEKIIWTLNKMYPLIMNENGFYYVFHNDVRLYLKEDIKSNSNYRSIVDTVSKNILKREDLMYYQYDILFDFVYSLNDLDKVFQLVTPDYIINSVHFGITLNVLIKQLVKISSLINNTSKLKYLGEFSCICSTLSQFENCIHYNEMESVFIDNEKTGELTSSEKYILNIENSIDQIVTDTYKLLKCEEYKRAKKLYDEYLNEKNLVKYLIDETKNNNDFLEKCGYICRYFNKSIFTEYSMDKNDGYCTFVKGWLKASVNYISNEEISDTFQFKQYYVDDLLNYIKEIVKNSSIDGCAYTILEDIISTENGSLAAQLELCKSMILKGLEVDKLKKSISLNENNLKTDSSIEFNVDRIKYYFMMVFCIYSNFSTETWNEKYNLILDINHISEDKRGYAPAIKQKILALKVFRLYYGDKFEFKEIQDILFELSYFTEIHGTGTCHDSGSYGVIRLLIEIFVAGIVKNENDDMKSKICTLVSDISTDDKKPKFYDDFIRLICSSSNKDSMMRISKFWCGKNGRAWNSDYNDIVFYCDCIEKGLNHFEEFEYAKEIKKRKELKIIGYTGHKDYSLSDLEKYFDCLECKEEKLIIAGMELLEISDAASDIGDNRVGREIDKKIFDVAVKLGPKYAHSLFELKNNPIDFVYWRDCLLASYFKYIRMNSIDDEQLFALYRLSNTWINQEIESYRSYNRLRTLYDYNSTIYDLIQSEEIKNKIVISDNPCVESSYHVENTGKDYSEVLSKLENGYCIEFENFLNDFSFKSSNYIDDLFVEIKEKIPSESYYSFVEHCLIPYIMKRGKYGFQFSGIEYLIEEYYHSFTEDNWLHLYQLIIEKTNLKDNYNLFNIGGDIEILTIYVFKKCFPEEIETLFRLKCKMHKSFITAAGMLEEKKYVLKTNSRIETLKDLVDDEIGEIT